MKKINSWTSLELASQVIFPRLNVADYLNDSEYKSKISKLVSDGIGGFCLFGGNIEDNIRVTNELQIFAEIPLLFCGDFENGISMRLSEGTEFPHSMALGNTGNPDFTYKTAKLIAQEVKAIGAFWNLAPVADINNNPKNPVINVRSFGENPEVVTEHSIAYIKATQSENVLSCAKHFPGHGNTDVNSHLDLPQLTFSLEELEKVELIPFKKAIESGVKSIMAGHLSIPSLDQTNLPATLSRKILHDLLRDKLGFQGIIITDALEMKAITNKFTTEQIAKLSIEAGVNVLLMPENTEKMVEQVALLAENPDYRNLLVESCELLINAKRWTGIMPQYHRESMNANLFTEHPYKALKYANYGLKFQGNSSLVPLNNVQSLVSFALLQRNENFDKASQFMKMLGDATDFDIDFAYLDENVQQESIDEFKSNTIDCDTIIFPIFFRNFTNAQSVEFPDILKKAIEILSEGKKSILIFFGSPYFENELKGDTKIFAYSDSYASLAAVVVRLSGRTLDWIED